MWLSFVGYVTNTRGTRHKMKTTAGKSILNPCRREIITLQQVWDWVRWSMLAFGVKCVYWWSRNWRFSNYPHINFFSYNNPFK